MVSEVHCKFQIQSIVVGVLASVQFCLECAYAYASCHVMHRRQKALWEKYMEGGSPMSPHLTGFGEKCSHMFVKTDSVVLTRTPRIELVMAQSTIVNV